MIDEKGRLFGKISVIDICILILILGGIFYVLRGRGGAAPVAGPVEDTFIIKYAVEAMPEYVGRVIENGDRLEDDIKGGSLGYITSLTLGEGYELAPDANGILTKSSKEGYVSLEIVSEVKGQAADNGVVINGNLYSVGQNVTMRAGKGKVYILLCSMEPKGGGQ